MKTVHDQVREALREAADSSPSRGQRGGEAWAFYRLRDAITPESAAKLRRLLK